jgi:hypothetical protein
MTVKAFLKSEGRKREKEGGTTNKAGQQSLTPTANGTPVLPTVEQPDKAVVAQEISPVIGDAQAQDNDKQMSADNAGSQEVQSLEPDGLKRGSTEVRLGLI